MNTKGFSLVELSISIIIIGLLVAGITSGTKLIQQAEIRAIISDLEQYKRDYFVFEDIYGAVPGDFAAANAVFTGCTNGSGAGEVNCNGNGDGYVVFNMEGATGFDGAGIGDETPKFHRHLNLAEINLRGGNTPIISTYSSFDLVGDVTGGYFPKTSAKDGSIVVSTVDSGNLSNSTQVSGTIWARRAPIVAQTITHDPLTTVVSIVKANSGLAYAGVLTPLQAFGIDRKIDDGNYSGSNAIGANTGNFHANTDLSGGTACISGANYTLTNTTSTCVVSLRITD